MIISEHFSEDKKLKAIIQLKKELLFIDFYENEEYIWSIDYPNKTAEYVEDAAENYVKGIFTNIKDYDVI